MELKPLNDLPLIEETASYGPSSGVYLVGGCVRDWLMGKTCLDLDFVFPCYPEKAALSLVSRHGGSFRKFEKFLTIRVLAGGRRIDLACFRKEKYPAPAALPEVERASSVEEDLGRRDFTANALALGVKGKGRFTVTDPYGGLADIKRKELRILHKKSFRDDPTRIFRAARFCGRFSWKLEKDTAKTLSEAVRKGYPELLSRERLRNELLKILAEKRSLPALRLLEKWGALKFIGAGIRLGPAIDFIREPEMRLAFLCGRSAAPLELLKSLNLEKKSRRRIIGTLAPLAERKSPLYEPDRGQLEVMSLLAPAKKKLSFSRSLLGAAELKKLGAENVLWSALLAESAALQWKGLISSGEEALKAAAKKLARLRSSSRGKILPKKEKR